MNTPRTVGELKGTLAAKSADMLGMVQRKGKKVLDRTTNFVDGLADKSPRVAYAVRVARILRLRDRIDMAKLPSLLDDPNEDKDLQYNIVDYLDSRMGVASPFYEEIELIAKRCLEKGIHPNKLVAFFETDEVLGMLLDEVLNMGHSRFRSTTLPAAISSALDSVILKLRLVDSSVHKIPVEGLVERQLEDYLEGFTEEYEPKKSQHNISSFMERVNQEFGKYDVLNWLIKKKPLFIAMLRGKKQGAKQHIHNIVYSAYESHAKAQGLHREFIKVNLSDFFSHTNFSMDGEVEDNSSYLILDVDKLRSFFSEELPRTYTDEVGAAHLRKMIIELCVEKMRESGLESPRIAIKDENTTRLYKISNMDEAMAYFRDAIEDNAKTADTHDSVKNFLFDPEVVPQWLKEEYTTFFDEDGELKRHKYNNFLRSIFGNIDTREETVDSIKKRLSKIFEEADEMMEDGRKSLSISGEEMSQAVIIIKDYAELVKIACKANGQKERFEARRKIEFMWQIYKSKYNPRFVFSKRDAKLVRERLEGPKDGVKIDPSAPFKILCFTDNPDGIEIVGESEMGDRLSASQEDIAVHLISAKFAGTDCCILPMDETHEDVGNKYIGRKSLKSIVMKKIRKRIKMDAIHDLLRTTFVAKTREDLLKIQQYLEDNYFGFATTLKRENRYGEFVAVETIDVADNKSKSDEYKALRYVAEIPISSETKKEIYIVPVEIRILLEEDLAKERSNYHDASHKNYERRRDREFMERMLPVEIYPHLYEEKTDPKDIFRKKQYKLKTA